MEAIGKLTGGIAHDFNNMLAVVVSGIDLAKETLVRDLARTQRHLDSAMEGATRAATLTDRLLAYARSEPLKSARVDVDGLVIGMRDLIHRATDDGIAVVLELNAGGWCIRSEEAQLENALLNLAINARDAMEGRGTLAIATRQVTLARDEIGQSAAGDYVCLSINDTGSGMPPEVMERIFEPFFTTKPVGKGTGLGLSQIFGFVRQSGGEIDVQSAIGLGTTFQIFLPRDTRDGSEIEASSGSTPPQVSAAAAMLSAMEDATRDQAILDDALYEDENPTTGNLILVVEDDPRVLRSTLAALQALGYRGISCDHPRKAADLLAANPGISLILSDVLMPDMTGPEMIMALGDIAKLRPIVFVTGFAGEGERAAQVAEFPTLRKPFTLVQLGAAVEDALNAHRHGKPAAPVH
jgi:CheY-like chemotaxis protein